MKSTQARHNQCNRRHSIVSHIQYLWNTFSPSAHVLCLGDQTSEVIFPKWKQTSYAFLLNDTTDEYNELLVLAVSCKSNCCGQYPSFCLITCVALQLHFTFVRWFSQSSNMEVHIITSVMKAQTMLTEPSQVCRWQHPSFGRQSEQYRSASETLPVSLPPATKCIQI